MKETSKKYLSDIELAISLIGEFLSETTDFYSYSKDTKTQSAVEMQLAIIGEALNKLKKTDSDFTLKNEHQIISFRNRLVHAYDSIDNAIVWAII